MNKEGQNKNKKKRLSNSNRFLLLVTGIYIGIAFFEPELIKNALWRTGEVLVKILPVLVLVFVVIYIINRYLNTQKIRKHLGEHSGWRGWVYAVIVGVLLAGPPYVLYPIFGDLQDKGMKNSLIAVIFYNRNVKLQFLPALIYYFGLSFSIILSVYMILFSLLNGVLVGALVKKAE